MIFQIYKGLPKSVYILFFANVVNSLGNFIWPFLAIFLTDRMGMGKADAGLIVTISAFLFAPGSLIGGKISDQIGRKRVFVFSRILAAGALIPCAFLGESMLIPVFLLLASFLTGAAEPAISAMVTDLTTVENRQRAFSLLYLGHNIGFAIGPMVAGMLYANHLPLLFLGDALTTLLSVTLVLSYVGETFPQKETDFSSFTGTEQPEKGSLAQVLLKRPEVIGMALTLMVYSLVYSQSWFSLPIHIGNLFGESGPKLFGTLMSINAITVVSLTAVATKYSAGLKPITNVVVGGLFYAVGLGMIYFIESMAWFVFSTVLWTIGEIVIAVNAAAFVANNSPVSHRGRFNSFVNMVSSAGHAIGPSLGGKFIDHFGALLIWPACFVLAISSAAVASLVHGLKTISFRRKVAIR